jgi:hypothetical protein
MKNHLKGDLSKLPLPLKLVPDAEKEILQSVADAGIGAAVGRDHGFSKLGKSITEAQTARFASESSCPPSANGLAEQSDTNSLLELFKATRL